MMQRTGSLGMVGFLTSGSLLLIILLVVWLYWSVELAVSSQSSGLITFDSDRDGNFEIYTMNADGTNQTNITNNTAEDVHPAWSPDGMKIAFTTNRDGNREIYVVDPDGANPTRLTNNPAEDSGPFWSPDGTQIAFDSFRDGNAEIYVMNADGTNQTRLTVHPNSDGSPSWSPSGAQIAFSTNRDGAGFGGTGYEIYVMNADGSNQTRLTNNTVHDFWPDWSPDGATITFTVKTPEWLGGGDITMEIYVMNADGMSQVRLTNNAAADFLSSWSPDGHYLTFTSGRDGNFEIYTMNADGTNQVRLTNNTAVEGHPDWTSGALEVVIDIKPGSDPNCFNNDGNGVIPVAILGSNTFDATQVDPATVQLEGLAVKALGKSNKLLASVEDVNGDGFDDLVVKIEDTDGVFQEGESVATLTGNLKPEFNGTPIWGTDSICIVP